MTYILISVDDSPSSRTAVRKASALAEKLDSSLHLIHGVEQTTQRHNGKLVQEGREEAEKRGVKILKEMAEETPSSIDTTTELVYGDNAVTAVLDFIESEQDEIEQVFIGHRKLTGRKRELSGSFAETLIKESPLPITVVSDDETIRRE